MHAYSLRITALICDKVNHQYHCLFSQGEFSLEEQDDDAAPLQESEEDEG